jgi:translation initiation factor 2 subunit 2
MADKVKDVQEEETKEKMEDPITRFLGSTKTTWQNFMTICQKIRREPMHVLDFFKAELDVEGNFGSEGNLILVGRYQNKNMTNLYK